jgi:hypothetical protein
VHAPKGLSCSGLMLDPIAVEPRSAKLLNTKERVQARVELVPSLWQKRTPYLRLCDLPTAPLADTVAVVRLEFDHGALPEARVAGRNDRADGVDAAVM